MEPSETDQPASRGETAADPAIDRVMFTVVIAVVAAACVPLGLMPERAAAFVSDLYDRLTHNFGFLYQWCAIGTMLFLTWLAAGRFGDVRLGGDGERPDFSTFSWAGMLFCAGSGASLLVWGGVEWITYYNAPPYGAEPRSVEAIEWATAYGPFHWGVTAWSLYALATIAIAYPFYVQRVPHLCTSTSWHALLGPQGHRSIVGRLVNLAAMLGLLGGAGTSLGLIAPMIAAVTAELFGIESSLTLEMGIVVFCVGLFGLSVYLGLERGNQATQRSQRCPGAGLSRLHRAGRADALHPQDQHRHRRLHGAELRPHDDLDRCGRVDGLRGSLDHFLLGLVDRLCAGGRDLRDPHLERTDDTASHPVDGLLRHAGLLDRLLRDGQLRPLSGTREHATAERHPGRKRNECRDRPDRRIAAPWRHSARRPRRGRQRVRLPRRTIRRRTPSLRRSLPSSAPTRIPPEDTGCSGRW